MSGNELSKQNLRLLDYILNYDPGERERPKLGFSDENIEELKSRGFINEDTIEDEYSSDYELLEINKMVISEVKKRIETQFEELYPEWGREDIVEFYEKFDDLAFEFYYQMRRGSENTVDVSLLSEEAKDFLQVRGIGFEKEYVNTSGENRSEFVFRTFPYDATEEFLSVSEEILEERTKNLSPVEKWAAYVLRYIRSEQAQLKSRGKFSPQEMSDAIYTWGVRGDNSFFPFVKGGIENIISSQMRDLINQDVGYLTALEYLKVVASQNHIKSLDERRKRYEIPADKVDEAERITGSHNLTYVQEYIEDLCSHGIVLREFGENGEKYILTKEALNVLSDVESRSKVESYPITNVSSAHEIFHKVLHSADEEVKVLDNYFDGDALKLVESNSPNNIRIMVLYSKTNAETSLKDRLEDIPLSNKYEIRKMVGGRRKIPHDRFVIIDNERVWQVGHSLNGVGNSFSTVFRHSESDSHNYVALFDDFWTNAEPFHP